MIHAAATHLATALPAYIPSPSEGVWHLGPIPVRAYALCIIAGVIAAVWIGERRLVARGGQSGQIGDIAIWAVPFGIVGGRLYHVMTDSGIYFSGTDKRPIEALYVWEGGLGIWGAIALGAVGAYIGVRRAGLRMPPVMDAVAPGLLVAQAIGRWGNWFNQELFGKPLDAWWALQISPAKRPEGYEQYATFHPTFLYECIWNLVGAAVLVWADKRFKLGHGRVFALYVMIYTAGRGWIEDLRIDPVEANDVFGLRLNVWTSIVLFVFALVFFVIMGRLHPGREETVWRPGREPLPEAVEALQSTDRPDAERPDTDRPDAELSEGAAGGSPPPQEPEPGPRQE